MKKITALFLFATAITVSATAQTTLFSETFGTTKATRNGCTSVSIPGTAETGKYDPQKNELYTDHDWSADSHVWNDGIAYSQTSATTATAGACDDSGTTLNVRANNPSTLTGASGNGNLYFNANITNSFTISGINTAGCTDINLSFEIFGKNKSDVTLLKLQYDNGSGLTDAGTTQIAALTTTKQTWLAVTGITLPASTALSLKFSTPNTNAANAGAPIEIRIDDITITGTKSGTSLYSLTTDPRKLTITGSTITLEGFTGGKIEIFNIQGKKVYSSGWTNTLQPQLSKGLYIIRIGDFVQKIGL